MPPRKNANGFLIKKAKDLPKIYFMQSHMTPMIGLNETDRLSCYHIKMPKNTYVEPSYHKKAVEMIWILKGEGIAVLGNKKNQISRGDVIFIRPPTAHTFHSGAKGLELLA